MSESDIKKRTQEFIEKIKNNQDAKLNLSVPEAQEVIWWWVYTDEFEDEEARDEAIENLRVEFVYEKTNEGDYAEIKQRIYNILNENESDWWLSIPVSDLLNDLNDKKA